MKPGFILLLLVISAGLISCNKNEPEPTLPLVTQEGLNTFGCIIDDTLLLPVDGQPGFGGGRRAFGIDFNYRKDSLRDSLKPPYFAIRCSDNMQNTGPDYIYIYIPSLSSSGSFTIDSSDGNMGIYSPPNPHVFVNWYDQEFNFTRYLSYDNSGRVLISRFDTLNTVIAGTFELRLVDADTRKDTIDVINGRFDINWGNLNCGHFGEEPCP